MSREPVIEGALAVARAILARHLATNAPRRERDPNSAFGPSAAEVSDLLRGEPEAAASPHHDAAVVGALEALGEALVAAPDSRLARLVRACNLLDFDIAIVCFLLAPEIEYAFERAYTYALDDVTRKRPDVGFVARAIGAHHGADFVLERLDEGAPLRRAGVITVAGAPSDPLALRTLRLADRIVAFLRSHDSLDEALAGCAQLAWATPALASVVMAPSWIDRIGHALAGHAGPPRVLLAGQDGTGRALVVEAILGEHGRAALRVDLGAIADDPRGPERVLAATREAALRDIALIFEAPGVAKLAPPRALVHRLAEAGRDLTTPIVFALRDHPGWLTGAFPTLIELDVPPPNYGERLELWRRALPPPLASESDLEIVAGRYGFTGAGITQTAHRAAQLARLRDPAQPRVTLDDLGDSARLMFSHQLGTLAQRIPTGFAWSDLVLPKETSDAVREVVHFARHRAFLLEDWGFAAKLPYGRGVSAILAGPPGTGKTMVAQLIAKELGYDLYRIDLSQVVDKYIGETEKNLGRMFDQAEAGHAVLFFDEADSLFAKRTNVQSSNDRYANLEVNYLLQRMETFDGVTLLATNLSQGIDDAFRRRVRFSIQFELPDEPERKRLWKSMFPPKVPLAADIDWDVLARSFAMAGGYIKKAAVRAALLAVEARRPITTADLLEAARLEYREMGRIA